MNSQRDIIKNWVLLFSSEILDFLSNFIETTDGEDIGKKIQFNARDMRLHPKFTTKCFPTSSWWSLIKA